MGGNDGGSTGGRAHDGATSSDGSGGEPNGGAERMAARAPDVSRRSTLELLAYSAVAGVAPGRMAAGVARADPGDATVLDVEDGETIDPYLEGISDGDEVLVPAGTYELNDVTVAADDWAVYGQGCTFDVQGDVFLTLQGANWTFSGVRFGVDSGNLRALPEGSNWTFRNCAWDGPNTLALPLCQPRVDAGSECTIDSCWFGDGMGKDVGESAIHANSDGEGTYAINGDLHIENSYFWQNPCYVAASAGDGQPGRVHLSNCYFQDAYLAAARTGSIDGTCNVQNCVVNLESIENVPETAAGETVTRGFWSYWGEVVVEDCDIYTPDWAALLVNEDKGDAAITAQDCEVVGIIGSGVSTSNIGNDPSRMPPDGCVTSAQEAVNGGPGGGGIPDAGTITFHGSDSTWDYRFGAGTELTSQDTIDEEDAVYANATASGSVVGDDDSYDYTGGITFCNVYGSNATVTIDSSIVDPADLGQLPNTVSVDSTDSDTATEYTLSVSGQLEKSTHNNASVDDEDCIADGTADGSVQGGADSYRFSGEITTFDYSDTGSFVLYVDGEQTDPDSVGSGPTVVDDFEDGDLSEYDFDRGASGASVVSSPTHSESHALEYAGTSTEAISTSGLNAYPSAGDTFEYWVRGSGGADMTNFTYGVQDHANRYFVRVNVAEDRFKLVVYENGSADGPMDKQVTGFTLSQDAWYRVTVQWGTDGSHTATLYDASGTQLAEISGSDATWTDGGIGFDAYLSSGQSASLDDVTIL